MQSRFGLTSLAKAFGREKPTNGHAALHAPAAAPAKPPSILDSYFQTAPSNQNAIDIFKGEWASKFPPPHDSLVAGDIPVFQDSRLIWGIDQLGGVYDQHILELGPLEGAHSYILERAGAGSVTAVEANSRAYLKCLIAKEIFNLSRTRFLCGDFVSYLQNSAGRFDAVVASGVLYHMPRPLQLLELMAGCTDRIYLWTHYYDAEIIGSKPHLRARFRSQSTVEFKNVSITEHRQDYLHSLGNNGYTGGSKAHSVWLTRDGILLALRELGFSDFRFAFEMPDHPHGPCFSFTAIRDHQRDDHRDRPRLAQDVPPADTHDPNPSILRSES